MMGTEKRGLGAGDDGTRDMDWYGKIVCVRKFALAPDASLG